METIFAEVHKNKKLYIFIAIIAAVLLFGVGGSILWFVYGNKISTTETLPSLVISSCANMEPTRLVVEDKKEFIIKNTDKADHTVSIISTDIAAKSKESKTVIADFEFGPGVYMVRCDGAATPAKIQVNGALAATASGAVSDSTETKPTIEPISFARFYDQVPEHVQKCMKTALAKDFDVAYKDATFIPSIAVIDKVNECTAKIEAEVKTPSPVTTTE